MNAANKVAFNTGIQCLKILLTMFISLYSTKLVINALGVTDYGIYNLVAGVVTMFSFMNAAMSAANLRFFSHAIGENDYTKLKICFSNSLLLHFLIGIILCFGLEIVGYVLFEYVLEIPIDKLSTAKIIFQSMLIGTFISVLLVPYDAIINAHEDMLPLTIIAFVDSMLKFTIALYISYSITTHNKLFFYGILIPASGIIVLLLKVAYAKYKYAKITSFSLKYDRKMMNRMLTFVSWNMFETLGRVFSNQGIAVVLNKFFGTVTNTSFAVASQVNGYLNLSSVTLLGAINPQIIKSEGANNRERMLFLSTLASKISFFLLAFFAIPIIIGMPFILKLWLHTVPDNTVLFCQLIVVASLMSQLCIGLHTAILAVGKIKYYQIIICILNISIIPLGIIFYSLSLPIYSIFILLIGIQASVGVVRLYFAKKVAGLAVKDYVFNVVVCLFVPCVITFIISTFISHVILFGFFQFIIILILSTIVYSVLFYSISLTKYEQNRIREMILSIIKRIQILLVRKK